MNALKENATLSAFLIPFALFAALAVALLIYASYEDTTCPNAIIDEGGGCHLAAGVDRAASVALIALGAFVGGITAALTASVGAIRRRLSR